MSFQNTRAPCKRMSVKEYFGWPDIQQNRDAIVQAYKSMSRECTDIPVYGTFIENLFNQTTPTNTYILVVTEIRAFQNPKPNEPREIAVTAGFAMAQPDDKKKTIFIDHLCTNNACRGAGRELMNRMAYIALRRRYPYIELYSVPKAVPFYKRLGFEMGSEPNGIMRLNVLWYFMCFILSNLSDNDMRSVKKAFNSKTKIQVTKKRKSRQ